MIRSGIGGQGKNADKHFAAVNPESQARRKFSGGYLHSALHPRWMFDETNVDSGSCEQAAREKCDEFGNLAHRLAPAGLQIEQRTRVQF